MKRIFLLLAISFALGSCSRGTGAYCDYVDTSIGSGGHGHVFVGANVPFGMVQLGPTSIPQDWDWCSGYHDSDSTVIGFSHTHLSGTGIGDLFDITVMPVVGEVKYARGVESDPQSGLWSYADRTQEISRPGYYSVPLLRYGVNAEMTATSRVGFHRYTFPQAEDAAIVFDLENGGCWDTATQTEIVIESETALSGYRFSRGWADDQKVYFYAELSRPFAASEIIQGRRGKYARLCYQTAEGEQLLLKVGISPVSVEGAKANMDAELAGWDFDAVVNAAESQWEAELSRIHIETADEDVRKIFYTALYHTMIAPSLFSDVGEPVEYTTFSLWDTYRAAMPLYSIYQSERYVDFINTMLGIYKKQGKLPVWHLHGCETNCMVGNPGIPPVADAIVKGFDGIDYDLAFEAMKASALRPDRGQDLRMKYGYIPCDLHAESVAYDLEYALADAALALAAQKLGRAEDAEYFENRSKSYKYLFDSELNFIRGKDSHGEFREQYSPFHSEHRDDDYCEGNGWQYTWLVPHDLDGLVECFGGREDFEQKLDSLFTVSSELEGDNVPPDISGLIGQYAHGNEPSHHILYFYTMLGSPWKTADRVREVLSTLYHSGVDGLSGNEDVGQMSAWYVLSSLGFYQVEPGSDRYWFGAPLFDRAEISVPGGVFAIVTEGLSPENRYIQSVTLNGETLSQWYIEHKDIIVGGELVFTMGSEKI